MAREDRRQALRRRDLVRRQPRRPRRFLESSAPPVEQRSRCAPGDLARRRFGPRRERDGERLRDGDQLLRENPRPARGGPHH